MHAILADLVVAVHVAYVSFIILGQLAILVGWLCRWRWIRNPWFRWIHLAMMAIVVGETLVGIDCPLTVWEYDLRVAAGQNPTGESFVGRMLHDLIYIELPAGASHCSTAHSERLSSVHSPATHHGDQITQKRKTHSNDKSLHALRTCLRAMTCFY